MNNDAVRCIAESVIDILASTTKLLERSDTAHTSHTTNTDIEIARRVIKSSSNEFPNALIDASADANLIKNVKSLHHTKKITNLNDVSYSIESLGGIFRRTEPDRKQYHYEERMFIVCLGVEMWTVTIRSKCSSDLIPIVIDYDQANTINEAVYCVNGCDGSFRSRSFEQTQSVTYDVYRCLDTSKDLEKECLKTVSKIAEAYESLFE